MNILTISLLSLVGLCLLIGIIKGATRGLGRQTVRTITIIASVILALVITNALKNSIFNSFSSLTVDELISAIEGTGYAVRGTSLETIIINLEPSIINFILALPLSILILPIIFVIIFYILKLLMLIVHVILSGLCGFTKKRNNGITRFIGAILGAITGFMVAVVIATPVVGLLSTADKLVGDIKAEGDEDNAIVEMYESNIAPYSREPMTNLMSTLGGKFLYSQFMSLTINETEYNAEEDIIAPGVDIAEAVIDDLGGFDWKNPDESDKAALIKIISSVNESEYIKHIILSLRTTIVDIYDSNLLIIEADELLIEAVDATFEVLSNITNESFEDDIDTLIEAYYILGENGALASFESGELEAVRDALTMPYTENGEDTTIVKKVVSILNSNDHTRPLVNALTKISLSALANNLGTELSVEEIYDNVKTGITDTLKIDKNTLTEDEYKSAVKDSIDTALRSSDIVLRENEQYILDGMADYVYENYETLVKFDEDGNQEITDVEINNIILSYYEAYLSSGMN